MKRNMSLLQILCLLLFTCLATCSKLQKHHPAKDLLSSFQPVCRSFSDIRGNWDFNNTYVVHPGFESCAITESNLEGTRLAHKHTYASNSFHYATFETKSCQILPVNISLAILQKNHMRNITVVGDSVGMQLCTALQCLVERTHRQHFRNELAINISCITDTTLAIGVLCHPQCLSNETFLAENYGKFPNKCPDCPKGQRIIPNNSSHELHWIHKVNPHTNVILLNTGPWYSPCWGIDGDEEFEETITNVVSLLHNFPVMKKYVLALPEPCTIPKYASLRGGFHKRNNWMTQYLANTDVHLLDVNEATRERFALDANVTLDCMHFQSPGPSSIPEFVSQVWLHHIAVHKKGSSLESF